MDTKQKMKRAAGWLLVLGVLVLVTVVVARKGDDWGVIGAEWGQAVVQGLAALGGAWIWAYRSRPRVTLHLGMRGLTYLDVENVGNRAAKQVQIRCDPPIPVKEWLGADGDVDDFGPVEHFGDMDRGQRYSVAVAGFGPHVVSGLENTTFEVSHESTWGFRRHRSTLTFGGAGVRRGSSENASTPLGEIASAVSGHGQKLDKIRRSVDTVARRLLPPAEGGDEISLKACAACGWERFRCIDYIGSFKDMRFCCINCGAEYENDMGCECAVKWCDHRPAPRQCRAQH